MITLTKLLYPRTLPLIDTYTKRVMSSMATKQEIRTSLAPQPMGAYSQAVRHDNRVYISGQIGLDVKTSKLVSHEFEAQAEMAFKNLEAIVQASGATLDQVVKVNIFITNFDNFPKVNQIMANIFAKPYPARSTVGVASLGLGSQVEVEAIVHFADDNTRAKL